MSKTPATVKGMRELLSRAEVLWSPQSTETGLFVYEQHTLVLRMKNVEFDFPLELNNPSIPNYLSKLVEAAVRPDPSTERAARVFSALNIIIQELQLAKP